MVTWLRNLPIIFPNKPRVQMFSSIKYPYTVHVPPPQKVFFIRPPPLLPPIPLEVLVKIHTFLFIFLSLRTPYPSEISNPFCGGSMYIVLDTLWNYTVQTSISITTLLKICSQCYLTYDRSILQSIFTCAVNSVWTLMLFLQCVVPENIHTPPTEGIVNSWTGRMCQKPKILKKMYGGGGGLF